MEIKLNRKRFRSRKYLSKEHAAAILELLERQELPDNNSPYRVYFHRMPTASDNKQNQTEYLKTNKNENN